MALGPKNEFSCETHRNFMALCDLALEVMSCHFSDQSGDKTFKLKMEQV